MAKCLVTGGAGFIGSYLTELLLSQGHEVVVLDDLSTGRATNLDGVVDHPNLTIKTGSITDSVLLGEVVHGIEVIYHLAAAVGVKLVADDPLRTIETNIYPTEQLLRFAAQGNVKKFFLASKAKFTASIPATHGWKTTTCILAQPAVQDGRMAARKRLMSFWPSPISTSTAWESPSDDSSTLLGRVRLAITEWLYPALWNRH